MEFSYASVARAMEGQRYRDSQPCPACGGDRLRPDFTGSGRCHAPKSCGTCDGSGVIPSGATYGSSVEYVGCPECAR